MIDFHRLDLNKKETYNQYLQNCGERGCEYSFTNLFLWGRQKAAFVDGFLTLFSQFDRRSVYPFPVGQGDIKPVLDAIIADSQQRGIPCRLTLLNQADMELLEAYYPGKFRFRCDRNDFDYVYNIDDLADLRGKKFQQKRNHLNRFEQNYPDWRVAHIDSETRKDAAEVVEKWFRAKRESEPEMDLVLEQVALRRAFENFDALGLEGLVLYAGGEPVAVTMGSRLSDDTFDVHFEKARDEIQGAYGAINRAFARHLREKYPELRYLNREDDLGLPGLRKAKQSYNPAFLVEKCWAYLAEEAYDD
jgi:hypothetical protein